MDKILVPRKFCRAKFCVQLGWFLGRKTPHLCQKNCPLQCFVWKDFSICKNLMCSQNYFQIIICQIRCMIQTMFGIPQNLNVFTISIIYFEEDLSCTSNNSMISSQFSQQLYLFQQCYLSQNTKRLNQIKKTMKVVVFYGKSGLSHYALHIIINFNLGELKPMNSKVRQQVYDALVKGQKCKYEGYPEWYMEQLLKNQPINITKFQGNYDSAVNFYVKEVQKLNLANLVLTTQLRAALDQKKELADIISSLQDSEKESAEDKKKRVRRCASQIERKYICQVINCDKSYGTEGSMAQHMRLKHPQIDYNPLQWSQQNFQDVKQKKVKTEKPHKKEQELPYIKKQ